MTFKLMLATRLFQSDFAEMLGNTRFRQYEFGEESIGLEAWLSKS